MKKRGKIQIPPATFLNTFQITPSDADVSEWSTENLGFS